MAGESQPDLGIKHSQKWFMQLTQYSVILKLNQEDKRVKHYIIYCDTAQGLLVNIKAFCALFNFKFRIKK